MATLALPALSENTSSSVPLPFFGAKVSALPAALEGRKKALEPAYYTNVDCFPRFDLRQNVWAGRNALRNLCLETLFMQELWFDGEPDE
jgi:hypothetical protein